MSKTWRTMQKYRPMFGMRTVKRFSRSSPFVTVTSSDLNMTLGTGDIWWYNVHELHQHED